MTYKVVIRGYAQTNSWPLYTSSAVIGLIVEVASSFIIDHNQCAHIQSYSNTTIYYIYIYIYICMMVVIITMCWCIPFPEYATPWISSTIAVIRVAMLTLPNLEPRWSPTTTHLLWYSLSIGLPDDPVSVVATCPMYGPVIKRDEHILCFKMVSLWLAILPFSTRSTSELVHRTYFCSFG